MPTRSNRFSRIIVLRLFTLLFFAMVKESDQIPTNFPSECQRKCAGVARTNTSTQEVRWIYSFVLDESLMIWYAIFYCDCIFWHIPFLVRNNSNCKLDSTPLRVIIFVMRSISDKTDQKIITFRFLLDFWTDKIQSYWKIRETCVQLKFRTFKQHTL